MKKYLTVVYDATEWSQDKIESTTCNRDASYLAWGHVPYQRDDLVALIRDLLDEYQYNVSFNDTYDAISQQLECILKK